MKKKKQRLPPESQHKAENRSRKLKMSGGTNALRCSNSTSLKRLYDWPNLIGRTSLRVLKGAMSAGEHAL